VLVLREKTERPEAVTAGTAELVAPTFRGGGRRDALLTTPGSTTAAGGFIIRMETVMRANGSRRF